MRRGTLIGQGKPRLTADDGGSRFEAGGRPRAFDVDPRIASTVSLQQGE